MKYIYESPDNGKTVYRRPFNSTSRELIREDGKDIMVLETIVTECGNQIIVLDVK